MAGLSAWPRHHCDHITGALPFPFGPKVPLCSLLRQPPRGDAERRQGVLCKSTILSGVTVSRTAHSACTSDASDSSSAAIARLTNILHCNDCPASFSAFFASPRVHASSPSYSTYSVITCQIPNSMLPSTPANEPVNSVM
ncbi:unnamed protein product [Taenia asiatica]|uniref:Uncharacterized protein n=1 Tax=Taenia asiatica TaxID=60517 RepID=A0A0R3VZ28_TAEAS|nr:unnamed protein product [Taenia asiatica]